MASFVVKIGVAAVLGLLLSTAMLSENVAQTHTDTQRSCSGDDLRYLTYLKRTNCISDGSTTYRATAKMPINTSGPVPTRDHIRPTPTRFHMISTSPVLQPRRAATGTYNPFPYGACTWYANQRYYQLYGVFVPWRINANAWQWTARAYEFGWRVSHTPIVGAIIDLQAGVQGASWQGHVAVVEHVLSNGTIIASSMSWGTRPWAITRWHFHPGPGVTFISQL
jgi:surface antigen